MKKISRDEFNKLTPQLQDFVTKLGIEIGEGFSSPRQTKLKDSCLESYACVVETECKLCKTTSISVFAMEGTGGLLTSKQSTLDAIEGMIVRTRAETVLTCPACHDILKLMNQEDLIALTLKAAKGDCRCRRKGE